MSGLASILKLYADIVFGRLAGIEPRVNVILPFGGDVGDILEGIITGELAIEAEVIWGTGWDIGNLPRQLYTSIILL